METDNKHENQLINNDDGGGRHSTNDDTNVDDDDDSNSSNTTDWRSIHLCTLFTFISSIQSSVFMPSMWPFMQILDTNASVSFFGIVLAVHSLSKLVASPLLGIWSNRIERIKPLLIFCNAIIFIGDAMYFFVELFPVRQTGYVLLCSRLVAGIGWAQVGLLNAYVASASVIRDRSRAIAFIMGGANLGWVVGPAFQMLFTWINYPGWSTCSLLHRFFSPAFPCLNISMFTAPVLFSLLLNAIQILLIIFAFHERFVGILQRKRPHRQSNKMSTAKVKLVDTLVDDDEENANANSNSNAVSEKLSPYDWVAVGLCYAMRFTCPFIVCSLEAISSPFAMMMFLWAPNAVVFWESMENTAEGIIALSVFISYIVFNVSKRLNDRFMCLCSLLAFLIFFVFTYSWPFLPNDVPTLHAAADNDGKYIKGRMHQSASVAVVDGGCNATMFAWCANLKQVNVWLYYVLMVLIVGLAFPNISVALNALFSQIIGPRMQSKEQGMLQMFGAFGKLLGPLLAGSLYRTHGPRAVWLLTSSAIVLMIALWLFCYKRLVAFRIPTTPTTRRTNIGGKKVQNP